MSHTGTCSLAVALLMAVAGGCSGVIGEGPGGPEPQAPASPDPSPGRPAGAAPATPGAPSTGSPGPAALTPPFPPAGVPGDVSREPPPSLGGATFTCDAATTGGAPRRLWRLTGTQYVNTVGAFLGRRPASSTQPSAPKSVTSPIEAESTAERFRNFASVYTMTDFEVRRGISLAVETAAALVATLRKTASSCLGAASNRPAFAPCMRTVIEERGALLFSRPLTPEEVTEYATVATNAVPTVGEDEAAALAFHAMLMSPAFLFRSELGDGKVDTRGLVRLTPFETAAALSYTLADAPPDGELWKAAMAGQLVTVEQIRAHAVRLIGTLSAKSSTTLRFLREYFEYDGVTQVFKDLPRYEPASLLRDTDAFVVDLLTTPGPGGLLRDLLTSEIGFHQRSTWMHYLTTSTSYTPQKFEFPRGQRAGILTQPSFLIAFSDMDDNQPVKRGRFVAQSLLCQTIPEIPIGVVPAIPEDPGRTLRERLKLHSADPSCSACHRIMDPLGMSFEAYDDVGRPRHMEAGKPVDASGVLSGAGAQDGPFTGAVQLMGRLAASPVVEQCFVRHAFRYWMGRNEQPWDGCALASALDAYRKSSGDYREIVLALITSPSFLSRSAR